MQSTNVAPAHNCEEFFASFEQIKIDDRTSPQSGLTVFQVEKLLGQPSTVSSGIGHNRYTYSVGRCVADVEFTNGRTVGKTFAISSTPVAHETQPISKPQQTYLTWVFAAVAVMSVIALVWYILRTRRAYEIEPSRQLVTPEDYHPDEPLAMPTDLRQQNQPSSSAHQQQHANKGPWSDTG